MAIVARLSMHILLLTLFVYSQQAIGVDGYVQRLERTNSRRVPRDQEYSSQWPDIRLVNQQNPDSPKATSTNLRQVVIQPNLEHLREKYRQAQVNAAKTQQRLEPIVPTIAAKPTAANPHQLTATECEEVWTVAKRFGITDISGYARQNCAILQMYFPESTCEEIYQSVVSCTVH
uniref:aECM cysteine-cradle domain-containing protein n=1 Tax=Plectus sambesii TaxID=2011161 RepID=A0A914WRK3_9BILA